MLPALELPFRATLRELLHDIVALNHVSRFGRIGLETLIYFELYQRSTNTTVEFICHASPLSFVDVESARLWGVANLLAGSFKK
jgi:hypothetical protein